jgi:hypothetical protein
MAPDRPIELEGGQPAEHFSDGELQLLSNLSRTHSENV